MRRRARGQAPARPLAASMHSTMASRSRTRQGRLFREGRIGASGEVVEQKIRFPAGDRTHELQARLSAKGEDGLANFNHGTWDMGHGVRDGDLTWDLAGGRWLTAGRQDTGGNWVLVVAAFGARK